MAKDDGSGEVQRSLGRIEGALQTLAEKQEQNRQDTRADIKEVKTEVEVIDTKVGELDARLQKLESTTAKVSTVAGAVVSTIVSVGVALISSKLTGGKG
jgi:septal ring factor EnvC (AmiA/AmiB activator)